jgi:hypothetical protein
MRHSFPQAAPPDWFKMKNLNSPAVKHEAEEDWGR